MLGVIKTPEIKTVSCPKLMVSSTCHLKMIEKQTDIDTLCLFIDLAADRTTEVLTV